MCWLPVDPPPLLADSTRSARGRPTCSSAAGLLASRLRRIGDRLEESWTSGGTTGGFGGTPVKAAARGRLSSLLRAAHRLSALVLAVARRHLQGREAATRRQRQQQMVPLGLEWRRRKRRKRGLNVLAGSTLGFLVRPLAVDAHAESSSPCRKLCHPCSQRVARPASLRLSGIQSSSQLQTGDVMVPWRSGGFMQHLRILNSSVVMHTEV